MFIQFSTGFRRVRDWERTELEHRERIWREHRERERERAGLLKGKWK